MIETATVPLMAGTSERRFIDYLRVGLPASQADTDDYLARLETRIEELRTAPTLLGGAQEKVAWFIDYGSAFLAGSREPPLT